ncbi:hypothetical protein [Pseudomonas sp. GM67]|nr:hypothetical protein [Pseudomonas sp. GM67]EJM92433.1 hypothetical protein PMI33_00690 [Pseudomonas sp. GM67]
MSTIPSDILLHLWLGFMLVLAGGLIESCRRLLRRDRIARGIRP